MTKNEKITGLIDKRQGHYMTRSLMVESKIVEVLE